MKDEEIIALAKKCRAGLNKFGMYTFDEDELIAFARAIADLQKEKDSNICYELSCASGGGKASTPGGACLECGDAIRSPETDLDEALRRQ